MMNFSSDGWVPTFRTNWLPKFVRTHAAGSSEITSLETRQRLKKVKKYTRKYFSVRNSVTEKSVLEKMTCRSFIAACTAKYHALFSCVCECAIADPVKQRTMAELEGQQSRHISHWATPCLSITRPRTAAPQWTQRRCTHMEPLYSNGPKHENEASKHPRLHICFMVSVHRTCNNSGTFISETSSILAGKSLAFCEIRNRVYRHS
jgi:hypothetical protein